MKKPNKVVRWAAAVIAIALIGAMLTVTGSSETLRPAAVRAVDPESSLFGYYDQDEKSFVAIHIGAGNPTGADWAFADLHETAP
ncbi:MAG: hypothetical protein ACKVT1_02585 [Dehalococcoidia bacterium]